MCYTYVALLKDKHNLNSQATSFVAGTLKPSSKALGTEKLEVVVYTVSIGKKYGTPSIHSRSRPWYPRDVGALTLDMKYIQYALGV